MRKKHINISLKNKNPLNTFLYQIYFNLFSTGFSTILHTFQCHFLGQKFQ